MRRFLLLLTFLVSFSSSLPSTLFAGGRPERVYEEDEDAIWIGPSWYGGIWIDNEADFDDWHHRHYGDRHRDHHRDGKRHHEDHGGGGGRGGGHHGGGHR